MQPLGAGRTVLRGRRLRFAVPASTAGQTSCLEVARCLALDRSGAAWWSGSGRWHRCTAVADVSAIHPDPP